ncbi:hypothetical protein FO519_006932 [Halicephalobus sp. NKZ332]|nr:hypothetical protein FO519_006932 [Halicephalobus sp. NKZ332]
MAMKHLEDMRNIIHNNAWMIDNSPIPSTSKEIENSDFQASTPTENQMEDLRNNIFQHYYDEALPPPELRQDTLENLLTSNPEIIQKIKQGELLNSCDRRVVGKQIFSRLCRYCRIPFDPSKKEKRIYFRFIFGTNNPSLPEHLYISSTAGTRGYFDTYCMNNKATMKSQVEGVSRKKKRKTDSEGSKSPKIRLEDQTNE